MSAAEPEGRGTPSQSEYALATVAVPEVAAPDLPYLPPMPENRGVGIALVGAGGISTAHLDAYRTYGLNVLAIYSRDLARAQARRNEFFPAALATDDLATLLRDPAIRVMDITTHPEVRVDLMRTALAAGKHVLSQKPFVIDVADGAALAREAAARGLKLAVNQNGRWAPHMAYMREAVARGLIGDVSSVHVGIQWSHEWIAGTAFDAVNDLILGDFGVHWFDFLVSIIGDIAQSVYATKTRANGQLARPALLAQALISFPNGQASLVFDGAARFGARDSTVIVGTKGTMSSTGSNLGEQAVSLHTEAGEAHPVLKGTWFNDGFAGAMGELLCAIEEERDPLNSALGNLASIRLCQAAIRSAREGQPVPVARDKAHA